MRATLLMWKKMPMSVSWNIPQADRMLQHSDSFGPHTAILPLNISQIAFKKQLKCSNKSTVSGSGPARMFLDFPKSGSVGQSGTDPASSEKKPKIGRKTFISAVLRLLFYFLSFKNDVNVP
jgi:hypothetical protein